MPHAPRRHSPHRFRYCLRLFALLLPPGSGLAGTIIGVVLGFILLVVLGVYGYSVYWWREHGLYGNAKPTYKYTKASKDDDDGTSRRLADAPLSNTASSIPLALTKQAASTEPASPLPPALPVAAKAPATTNGSSTTAATTATPAATATPASPTKPKMTLPVIKHTPTVPANLPVSPSNVRITTTQDASSGRPAPTSPKSPKGDTALPDGWSLHKDASGNQYYFNTSSGQSQWSKPTK